MRFIRQNARLQPFVSADSRFSLAKIAAAITAWMERWFPDSFVFALLLTVFVFVASCATGRAAFDVVKDFGDGFWGLVPFTMQMVMVILGGFVMASSPPVRRLISFLAEIPSSARSAVAFVAVVATTITLWGSLPANYMITRLLGPARPGEQRLIVSEGLTEVLAVTEIPGDRRVLITNGYSMSGTSRVSRLYMRAAAHIPLLSLEAPERVLVIGFGVGNTLHAASLHPSIRGLETVDLSPHILGHASYFSATNGGVITHPRVSVYINDGRHHLRMRRPRHLTSSRWSHRRSRTPA